VLNSVKSVKQLSNRSCSSMASISSFTDTSISTSANQQSTTSPLKRLPTTLQHPGTSWTELQGITMVRSHNHLSKLEAFLIQELSWYPSLGLDTPTLPLVPTSRKVITVYVWSLFTVHNCTHLTTEFIASGNGSILDTATLYKDRTCDFTAE
jgi:hypothetical protein